MMHPKFEQSGAKGLLTLEGELVLRHADELRAALIKALINADHVDLELRNVTAADLSCLQLLCSAHRSAVRMNKHLVLRHERTDELSRAAEAAGYLRHAGCRLDIEKTCLWRVSRVRE